MNFVQVDRPQVDDTHLTVALEAIIAAVEKRLKKHGKGMIISDHEALGILTEEYQELVDAVTANDRDNIIEEWLDIAVTSVITVASVVAGAEIAGREEQEEKKKVTLTKSKLEIVDTQQFFSDSSANR